LEKARILIDRSWQKLAHKFSYYFDLDRPSIFYLILDLWLTLWHFAIQNL